LKNRIGAPAIILVVVLILVGLVGLTWANYRFVVANPGGSDFIPAWMGARLFLTKGWSPYGDQVKSEIQNQFYGGTIPQGNEISFDYPLYSTLLFVPFAMIPDYTMARAVWMTAMEVALLAIALLSIVLVRWRLSPLFLAVFLVFSILWYHALGVLVSGNVVILCTLFVVLALLLIRSGFDAGAGFFLALATIKPNIVILLLVLVLLWGISQRRWQLVAGFLGSLFFLTAFSMLLIPDWIFQEVRAVLASAQSLLPGTPGEALIHWMPGIGKQLSWTLTIVLIVVLVLEWRAVWGKEVRWFLWTACLTLVINEWIGIRTDPKNFLILYTPMVLIFATWEVRWGKNMRWATIGSLVLLGVGLWALFISTLNSGDPLQSQASMFFPLPLFLFFGLYWVRWWAIRSTQPYLEQLRSAEGRAID
jgi:Glycosyltransferase family 87